MLNELRAELATVIMTDIGEQGTYIFSDTSTQVISVRIYDDVIQFDEYGSTGTQVELGIDINVIPKCQQNEKVLVNGKTYTIHSYIRKVGNIKRYKVV